MKRLSLFLCIVVCSTMALPRAYADSGRARVQELVRKLSNGDARDRWSAASGLAYTAKYRDISMPALQRALNDSDLNVRTKAAESLRKLKSSARKTQRPKPRQASHRPPPSPKESITQKRLPPMATPNAEQMESARQIAKEKAQRERVAAERIAAKKREADARAAKRLDEERRRVALEEDKRIEEQRRNEEWATLLVEVQTDFWNKKGSSASAKDRYREALYSTTPTEQARGALGAAFLPELSKRELKQLISLLTSPSSDTKANAALAIGQLGAEAAPAVRYLSRSLLDSDPLVRQRSAEALGRIGVRARAAASALSLLLEDKLETIEARIASIIALGRIGFRSNDIESALQQSFETNDTVLKSFAAVTLGQIKASSTTSVAVLGEARNSRDEELQRAARWALLKIRTSGEEK